MTVTATTQSPQDAQFGPCPACRSEALVPLAESLAPAHTSVLLSSREEARSYPRRLVRLARCRTCGFITNTAFDAAGHDYSASYEETQAHSPRFRTYAEELARDLSARYDIAGRTVVEIGCGRGDFLQLLCDTGRCRGLGVDPSLHAEHVADLRAAGIDTERAFFAPVHVRPDTALIVCRHTLEHIQDVHGFLSMLAEAVRRRAPGAAVYLEVPDTMRVLRETAFWDIYYEHCSYFTPGSLACALRSAGLGPTSVELGFEDQYVQVTAEEDHGVHRLEHPREERPDEVEALAERYRATLARTRAHWGELLRQRHNSGSTVVLWGAGSKCVGFLAELEADDRIACVVDVNPAKQGKYVPGSGHLIVPPADLVDVRPDLVVVMNGAYAHEIQGSLAAMGLKSDLEVLA